MQAAFAPIVDVGEDDVLIVEIVVEDGDLRRIEGELLREGPRAFHAKLDGGRGAVEGNAGGGFFGSLGGPVIGDGRAVGTELEGSGDFDFALRGLDFR